MPGMNGFELTKRLKNSFETSHIPIILLTALSTDENVLEGTESGADAYITKPFSPQLLMARILQLLNQREILRQKFGKVPQEIRSAMLRNEQDSLFVKRLDSIVYSRLGEQDLSVVQFGILITGRKNDGCSIYAASQTSSASLIAASLYHILIIMTF
jgi:DNA-binding response OmpR family regulator